MTLLSRVPWRRAAALLLVSLGAACASKINAVIAPTSDYADYRLTRVAPTLPERLKAAARYLELHPDGAFHGAVASWYLRVEPVFFHATSDSLEGTEKYLETLPTGPHASSAEQRRDAFRAAAAANSGERIAAKGAEFERRLAAAAQSRDDVITAYTAWLGRVLDFEDWGRPIDNMSGAFSSAWMGDPNPKCTPDRCTKQLTLPYELQVAGKPQTFVCLLEISMRFVKGRVADVTIGGPGLFARLAEARSARPSGADEGSRARALASAIELTEGAAERRLPRSRCAREGATRAALVRECDGRRLDLYAAAVPDEAEDRVVIRGPGEL
jgi:hypothetical protein